MQEPKSTGAIKKKRDQKKNRKDSISWENVRKDIEQANDDEKWSIMENKYRELYESFMTNTEKLQGMQKVNIDLDTEKGQLNRDLTKAVLGKTKMESLARELQKQNKEIKEQCQAKLREEEERRKAMATSFSEKLGKLNTLMDENRDNSVRLKDENLNMRSKLSDLYNQFQEREHNVIDMNKQIDLQNQLSQTHLKKLELEFATEKEVWSKEKSLLLSKCERLEKANQYLEENVKSLQGHLDAYQNQFTEFENTIRHSNQIYTSFKDDMAKLHKTNKEIDKDRKQWKTRSEGQFETILRMTEANEALKLEALNIEKKRSALEKLCRQLQLERMTYIQKLKDCNVPTPTQDASKELSDLSLATEPSNSECNSGNQENNSSTIGCQTEFSYVVRRLPIRQPATEPDSRAYFELEEGKLMKFTVDIRCIHNRYVEVLEKVVQIYNSKLNVGSPEVDTIVCRLRDLGSEETDLVLDLGVIADKKIALVVNLGMSMDRTNVNEQNKIPKIWIRPIETLLARPEDAEEN